MFSPKDELYEDQMTETMRVPAFERTKGALRALASLDFRLSLKQTRPRFLYGVVKDLVGPEPKTVLDVGCGGGKEILKRLGPVAGVDISLAALANARRTYSLCVRHDIRRGLPFPDQSFDVVVCTDVLGHFAERDRDFLLSEVRRVTKPGGHFVAFVETWSGIYERRLREHPDWYPEFMKEMIAQTGHIGMEPTHAVLDRFGRHGFQEVRRALLGSGWGYTRGYVGRSIQKYPAATRRELLLRRLAALAVRSRVSEWTLDGILGFLGFASARSVTAGDAIAVLLWSKREDRD